MDIKSALFSVAERCTDRVFAALPRSAPPIAQLSNCKLIGHRGDYSSNDSSTAADERVVENTIAAFDRCQAAGVWGIEMDVQWTRDGVPVVIHDTDAGRVFAQPDVIVQDLTYAELHKRCPLIPSLEQVVSRFAGKLHLMVEIKADTWQRRFHQHLANVLKPLEATQGYHLLCLETGIFEHLTHFDPNTFIPVAITNTQSVYNYAINYPCAGMSGHFVLLNRRMRTQLAKQRKNWGTGFITSQGALHREIHNGTDWLFSNQAVGMQAAVEQLKKRLSK
jgi:glycerophosphoryl diester phosphodiesterase